MPAKSRPKPRKSAPQPVARARDEQQLSLVETLISETQLPAAPTLEVVKASAPNFAISLLALSSIKGMGRKSLVALINAFDGALSRIWEASVEEVRAVLTEAKTPAVEKIADEFDRERHYLISTGKNTLEDLLSRGISIMHGAELPESFSDLPNPPRWLFVQGNKEALLKKPVIAVVGTRHPSEYGRRATGFVAKQIAAYPITLVSGLAEGVDEEAHRVSLQENVTNVAFLGHGINIVFPAKTSALREQIVKKGGAVATEYLPDEHYQKPYFVERNRLQAALAQLVIPVEANPRGGTAHTIRYARELKRQIVGIKWRGANGILSELEHDGYPIADIQSSEGQMRLDRLVRELAISAGHDTNPLSLAARSIQNEMRKREVSSSDLDDLLRRLKAWQANSRL